MDYQGAPQNDYSNVFETLKGLIGNAVSDEVILAVIESCGGDLNESLDALMNIANDSNETSGVIQNNNSTQCTSRPANSYAGVSHNTGAVPKQMEKFATPNTNYIWTDQDRKILTYHNQGSRLLLLMRGVPGSGKTFLARKIVEMTVGATLINYRTHICSTDDYFMASGQYRYDRYRLSEAHIWNQNRVRQAMKQGLSPIIIDNTNIEIWEMEPYVRDGVRNGYIIEVVEPSTPWAKKANQLVKKNTHNVPLMTIKRMLDNYQNGITGNYLLKFYGLSYPADMKPPVLRVIPAVSSNTRLIDNLSSSNEASSVVHNHQQATTNEQEKQMENLKISETHEHEEKQNENQKSSEIQDHDASIDEFVIVSTNKNENIDNGLMATETREISTNDNSSATEGQKIEQSKDYAEVEKYLAEIEKVDKEWENGESWGDDFQEKNNEKVLPTEPKPPRRNDPIEPSTTSEQDLLASVNNCEDWRQISLFMPSWNDNSSSHLIMPEETMSLDTISSSTCMEIGDMDINNTKNLKVINATPRDINLYYMAINDQKIPKKLMLDKSTMTNEHVTTAFRCKNEDKHFNAFKKLFKNIDRAYLRDIFDNCCGDVNWAVEIVLDGMSNNQLTIIENDMFSDSEDLNQEQCDCVAAYNIIPDVVNTVNTQQQITKVSTEPTSSLQRKIKKTLVVSESSMQLKRQIEQNVVISDNHYSQHCLKLRKLRRGGEPTGNNLEQPHATTDRTHPTPAMLESNNLPSTSKDVVSEIDTDSSDNDDNTSMEELERTVNVNLGIDFVTRLDELFGRTDMIYPENIIPKISMPLSLLNEINALWMESLMNQLEDQAKHSATLLQQDEEFARQLAMKEEELAQAGKEPKVPDFKEIMDMDFALTLYQKDVAEWRNNAPNDLAAKMTREKLYNLFPDVPQDTLSELLVAHSNNFQQTVEVLLMSTGREDVVQIDNGVNKFVMQKEMERQEKLLEQEKKALSEVEWPLLAKGENVEMSTVTNYREEAKRHLEIRNVNYQKAQEYIRRDMPQVANYYSDIAAYHKQKFEQANSLAAASLMQVHAANCTDNATIDLHYLHVAEAKESLDLFIDTHIHKLKESQNRVGPRYHTLFFITGRGLHSVGRPRVKPAVKKRLKERGLTFTERNPGLLSAKVCAEDRLTYQVQ